MPYSYIPLWNLLNEQNISKSELCQRLRISSSTMAKMTNNQKVSMDILARICDYFTCDLQQVVVYVNEIEDFMNRIRSLVADCSYTYLANEWPEYRFQLSDAQMCKLQSLHEDALQSFITECEHKATIKNPVTAGIIGTTKYSVIASRNMIIMQGAFPVIELFIPWFLKQVND